MMAKESILGISVEMRLSALHFLFSGILIYSFVHGARAWRSFTIEFDEANCTILSDALAFFDCSVARNGTKLSGLTMTGKSAREVKFLKVDMLLTTTRMHKADFVMLNLTRTDGCQFLLGSSKFHLYKIMLREFNKFAKLPKRCPIMAGYEFNLKNLVLNPDNFPTYVPETHYTVRTILSDGITPLVDIKVKGRIEYKRKIRKQKLNGMN